MARIHIVDLEAVDTRYTGEWKTHLPELLTNLGHDINVIDGPTDIPDATTPGAFLNFGGTNVYKAKQIETMGRMFCNGSVQEGDHFIFADAWHPGIINLRYMSSLLNIPITIHALWHAGSYDPHDFLGRLIGDAGWVRDAERSFFGAVDYNYFATDFHIDMFCNTFMDNWAKEACIKGGKITRAGWPMEYMASTLDPYKGMKKRDLILFPHRLAPEKQVDIFNDLKASMPQYEFVVCQEQRLTKHEYHTLLGEAKMVFSANLQETLGISCYEGAIVDAMPIVPDRLSYVEMYNDIFKYPSEWTESFDMYMKHKEELCTLIDTHMQLYDLRLTTLKTLTADLSKNFFSCSGITRNLN